MYIVEEPEQGVELRFGKFVGLTDPGPHWIARPFYDVQIVDVSAIHTAEIGFRNTNGAISSVAHESLMLTADENTTLLISGTGDVIEHDEAVAAIGSGGSFATAAATALIDNTELDAKAVAEKAMQIAAKICIYTNANVHFEELG